MILTFSNDFTSQVSLDAELTSIPDSGMYLNSGVHPSININSIISIINEEGFTFIPWNSGTTYIKFEDSRNTKDIVTFGGKTYQSILTLNNLNKQPDLNPTFWLETNLDSIKIKMVFFAAKDKVKSDLNLTRRLVDNQFLYHIDGRETAVTLPNDFAAWVFEPKGSDYVKFRINQVCFRATTTDPINLFVVNQGVLVDTLILTPEDGKLVFDDLNYTFSGKGKWIFSVDSREVLISSSFIDPLKYTGFVAYMATGTGATPEGAEYSFNNIGNGLCFNITAYFDSTVYLDNNLIEYGKLIQAAFELEVLNTMLYNGQYRNNDVQKQNFQSQLILTETKDFNFNTVANKYNETKIRAIREMERTFDTQLNDNFEIELTYKSI